MVGKILERLDRKLSKISFSRKNTMRFELMVDYYTDEFVLSFFFLPDNPPFQARWRRTLVGDPVLEGPVIETVAAEIATRINLTNDLWLEMMNARLNP
jgi:hypothetical protein